MLTYLILIKFFKNRKLVEDIIKNSINGLKVNKKALAKIITLFEKQTSPVGHNIKTYESLCKKLILEKETVQTLKKIA